jgi:hypothetical protein
MSEVKQIISADITNFDSYLPEDEETFSFPLQVLVGPKGEPSEESFNIQVCTPKWLLSRYNENEIILGAYKLIVFKFDMERILARVRKIFDNCDGKDWNEIAIKLSRVGVLTP